MKTRVLAILAVVTSTLLLCAQDPYGGQSAMGGQGTMGSAPNKAEIAAKLEKISTELQLTPAQKQQMLPILKEEAPKIQAIKSNTSLGPLQKRMQLRQIGEATDAKVQPILSPEQYQKWQQMRAQEKEQMMQKMENKQ
jgi:periplasmic protein CpxP/Spy